MSNFPVFFLCEEWCLYKAIIIKNFRSFFSLVVILKLNLEEKKNHRERN